MTERATAFSTPDEISYFRFASIKQRLKLESVGLKFRGGSTRSLVAKEFGLKPRAPFAEYIAYCESQMAILIAKKKQS
jgi:hypothetical protein